MSRKRKSQKLRTSIEKKYILGLTVLAITMMVSVNLLIWGFFKDYAMKKYKYEGFAITRYAASLINGNTIQNYMITKEADEYYYAVLEVMRDIKAQFSDIRYFYVIVPGFDDLSYIWETSYDPDTEPNIIGFRTGYSSEEGAEIMLNSAFKKNPEEILIEYEDPNFGPLVTAASPIFNSKGTPVALICVDLSKTLISLKITQIIINISMFVATIMIVSILLHFFHMRRSVIRPIADLTDATLAIADNLDGGECYVSNIHTGDELERLSNSIEKMDKEIRTYISENAKITAEKERLGAELDMAKSIQASQLPSIFPAFPERKEFDIYASMDPAKEVGGDFYDFFMVDNDHLALVIADVSGKGVPAALFMMISKILIKNHIQNGDGLGATLESVNNQLLEGNEEGLFVTVWMALVEISTGKGIAVNAGHEHPALRRAGEKYELIKYRHSPAVSTVEGIPFKEHEFELHPGDSIFVYTDGVAEATSKELELFGTERMLDSLNTDPDAKPEMVLQNVTKGIDDFVGDAEQFDDITMLCFKYNGSK
jgi:Serine phosphatase RsbU, regulator of sigma subunit